jgi:F420H(2)-dependent quinone reductase
MMNRFVNPLVRMILRSRAHRLLSSSLALLTYTGRTSGRHYSLPVMYTERTGELVVFAGRPREKKWWRNFLVGAPVQILLRGRALDGWAEAVLDDEAAIGPAWAVYAVKFPKAAAARRVGDDAVFVRITLFKDSAAKACPDCSEITLKPF